MTPSPSDPSSGSPPEGAAPTPQRRFPRLQEPQILGALTFRTKARVFDLSAGGIGLVCREALPPNHRYRLTLRDGSHELRLEGKTVWNRLATRKKTKRGEVVPIYRAGIKFDDPTSHQGARIKDFISQTGARPAANGTARRFRPTRKTAAHVSGESGFVVKTISRSGALLETGPLPQHESTLALEMQLPSGGIEVEGRLVNVTRTYDESGEPCTRLAVEFRNLSAEGHARIEQLVDRAST